MTRNKLKVIIVKKTMISKENRTKFKQLILLPFKQSIPRRRNIMLIIGFLPKKSAFRALILIKSKISKETANKLKS